MNGPLFCLGPTEAAVGSSGLVAKVAVGGDSALFAGAAMDDEATPLTFLPPLPPFLPTAAVPDVAADASPFIRDVGLRLITMR